MSKGGRRPPPSKDGKRPPRRLLGQNRELAGIKVWNWSLPALAARLRDGSTVRTCPAAGVCAQVCYARQGTYRFPSVQARHLANLEYVLADLDGWRRQMTDELHEMRFQGGDAWVRIHDSGDFFSDEYLLAWLRVMASARHVRFYAYTKEIARFKKLVEPDPPKTFRWVYSLGGTEDHLVDLEADRVADVFPDAESIEAAGWHSQDRSDLLAVYGPTPVGIPANNIPQARHRQGDRTLGQWQAERPRRNADGGS
ncbi:hypothetical protein GCM10023196_036780 [Actinoallomurus vinaceus]|uniref:Gene product 88 domain-containing protein n=1 Tax=Actinoallomurus vinaceus TaxID=1080074 RepID=A0ABP8UCG7_9ACTN